ncbi:MAG: LPS-assembly protein LptD [Chitinispirillaceae bacterium]|nr:LPS-assembly protein LptD [Chitinispirillaceae bacterium]
MGAFSGRLKPRNAMTRRLNNVVTAALFLFVYPFPSLGNPPDSAAVAGSPQKTAAPDSSKERGRSDLTDTVHYESDLISYDADGRVLRLVGRSKVKYQNIVLLADTIIYTMNDNLFTATGRPQLVEDRDTTVGDFMAYNIKTKRGRVRYATTHVTDAYFSGQRIVKSEDNELFVDKGDYSTCAFADTPHYYFYGEHIRFVQDDKIVSKPAVLNIGGAPVAVLPYFIFPVERSRKSGILTPVWGGNPAGGGYVDNVGYYWALNDYMDLTASARIREFSEFVLQAKSRYSLKYRLNGGIGGRYVFNSEFLKSQRQWALDYSHNQNLTPDGLTQFSGRGNLVSAKNFYSNFSQDSSELSQALLTSNLSLSRQFQEIKGSGSVVWNRSQDLSNGDIGQDLPSVSFSLFDRPLIALPASGTAAVPGADTASHWYNNIYWGYSMRGIYKSQSYGDSKKRGYARPGLSNEFHVSAPQKILKYITVSPSASANLSTFYGYFDTMVSRYDFDTIQLTGIDSLSDTAQYPDYRMDSFTAYESPSADTTITLYDVRMISKTADIPVHPTHDSSFANVFGWRAGFSASTNLYGILPLRIFNLAGIRHTLSPSISYTYVPEHRLDKTFYPVGISYEGGHDRQQLVRISLANQFHGKIIKRPHGDSGKPQEVKFPLLSASLSTQYDFEAKPGTKKWSDLNLSASTGYRFLGLSYSSTFWLYDKGNEAGGELSLPIMQNYGFNLSTGSFEAHGKLWDGDRILLDSLRKPHPLKDLNAGPQSWRITVTPAYSYSARRASPDDHFIPAKTYCLNASASCGFTRNWKISWSGNYNFMLDQMVQNSINLTCDLECWEMKFQWRPERLNPGYYFIINVKKIPDLKWEQRDRY